MSSARILARLHKKGADQAPRLAAFTECVVEYFGGDNGVAKVYTWLESNSLIISDSQTPQSKQLYIKHPSFCPIRQLSSETVELPEATLSQGINTGVAIILESSDGKVLLTKRAAHLDAFPNVWVPPGGHVELNETLTEAGLRELHEETGLCITEEECQGRELAPLVLWESVYPPRLSLGIPKKHHIVLYLHAKLTENHTSDKLFDQLKFDPAEVAACVWVDHSIIKSIVQQCEERTVGDVERNPKLSQTIRALTLDEQQKQVVRDISIDPLLQRSSLEQDCERVSTGTKYALEQFLQKTSSH